MKIEDKISIIISIMFIIFIAGALLWSYYPATSTELDISEKLERTPQEVENPMNEQENASSGQISRNLGVSEQKEDEFLGGIELVEGNVIATTTFINGEATNILSDSTCVASSTLGYYCTYTLTTINNNRDNYIHNPL